VKVVEALELIQRVGVVESSEGKLRLKFPERERTALQPAIDALRNGKTEAIALLTEPLKDHNFVRVEPQGLESVLKGSAIELWSTAAGRLFLVADEADAVQAMERFHANRGETYTAAEARRIILVKDPAVVAEIHDWKHKFDGVVSDFRRESSD
jgi:hypothetical protein